MKGLVLVCFCFVTWSVMGQYSYRYTPIPILDTIPAEVHAAMKARLELDKSGVDEPTAKAANYAKQLYKGRFEYIVQTFNEDKLIVDSELNQYLTEILQKIQKANPELPQDVSVYVYRSSIPNAICFGEGTIAFSLSLLNRLENEDQVAFVLCHELAHHFKKHADLKVKDLTKLNFDKKLSKQVKEIKATTYGQYTKLKDLMQGLELSLNHHSREKEFEADSIGLQLFLNTSYQSLAPLRTMEILDSADQSIYRTSLDIKKHFNLKGYPYRESWGEYVKSDTWFAKKNEVDSLKTHPSCKKRWLALQRQLERANRLPAEYVTPKDEVFSFIKTTSEFEQVESEYHFKEYGKALFRAMMMLERFPDNAYLHGMIGKCLFKLHENQKNHTLGKVLELPDPRFTENYDRFLTFFHRLRLVELENLAYYYVINQDEKFFSDEEFLYATWLCSRLSVSKLDSDAVRDDYRDKFPDGRYLRLMK